MDSSFTIKPSPAVAKSRALRDPVPVRETIETELVGAKSVSATGDDGDRDGNAKDGGAKDSGARDPEQRPDHAPHDLVANPESHDVIYRERDVRSTERQHPDHALLRLRAYRPVVADSDPLPTDDPHADIRA